MTTYEPGNNYYILTTDDHSFIGELLEVSEEHLIVVNGAKVDTDGHLSRMFQEGYCKHVEPLPSTAILLLNKSAVIFAATWPHPVPRTQK